MGTIGKKLEILEENITEGKKNIGNNSEEGRARTRNKRAKDRRVE